LALRTFEDVTIFQLLPLRTLSKTLLQRLEGFRAQRILTGWTGDDGGALSGGGSGSVGGSYERFRGVVNVSTLGRVSEKWRVRTHGWIETDLKGGGIGWMTFICMFTLGEIQPGAETREPERFPALVTIVLSCLLSPQRTRTDEWSTLNCMK